MSSVALPMLPLRPPASHRRAHLESSLGEHHAATLLLRDRAAPLTVPTGIAPLDRLTGGLPRGALTEITGPPSSGRTGVMLAALAAAARRQEVCALVDAGDSFHPASAVAAGVDLDRLLWVRCAQSAGGPQRNRSTAKSRPPAFAFGGALQQVLQVTDLLLHSGGFGMVVLDLGDIPVDSVRRVPLTSWFRFRRAVEPTATVLLLIEQAPCARTCASLVLRLQAETVAASQAAPEVNSTRLNPGLNSYNVGCSIVRPELTASTVAGVDATRPGPNCESHNVGGIISGIQIPQHTVVGHAALLRGVRFRAEVVRSWAQRKPPQSLGADFELCTAM